MTVTRTKLTNAQRFANALKRNGVEYIFGQSNPSSITLACIDLGIQQIGYREENAGTYMAQAYGMVSGKVPVVTAQNGPAATLLVPGLAECLKASYPIVAIVQDVSRNNTDRNAFQELDHEKLFDGVAKWVKKVICPDRIEDYVDMAFTAAASGRPGPAVLLCPMDMINDKTLYDVTLKRSAKLGYFPLDRVSADPQIVKYSARLLADAKCPIIYAGGGVISSNAEAELRKLQKDCMLPVATTTMGKGAVDENDPLSMGVLGYFMGKRGNAKFLNQMVQNADVIFLVGNRTNQNGTDSWTLLPDSAQYIQLDVDPMEVGRNYEAVRLVGDAKLTLTALYEEMMKLDLSKRLQARSRVVKKIADAREKHNEEANDAINSESSPIRLERFLSELEKQLDKDHIIVADASFSSIWIANYIKATGNRKFIFPRGLAGLGWGFPMAMGAKVANPGRKVFCLAGDGGFAHVWSELETCKRHGIDVVLTVINNEILAYQRYSELSRFGRYTNATELTAVDHTLVAKSCGAKGIRVSDPGKIREALEEAMQTPGCTVIDLIADPGCIPPVPSLVEFEV